LGWGKYPIGSPHTPYWDRSMTRKEGSYPLLGPLNRLSGCGFFLLGCGFFASARIFLLKGEGKYPAGKQKNCAGRVMVAQVRMKIGYAGNAGCIEGQNH
jgi:hypothetical protein